MKNLLSEIELQRIPDTERGLPENVNVGGYAVPLSELLKDPKPPKFSIVERNSPVLMGNPKLRNQLFEVHERILKKNAKDFP